MKNIILLISILTFSDAYTQAKVTLMARGRFRNVAGNIFVSKDGTGNGGSSVTPMHIDDLDISDLPSGTVVNLKGGDVFETTITVSKKVYITSYGTGKAIISGSDDIGGNTWTLDGSDIYYTVLAGAPKWVFINGVQARLAQTPYINTSFRPSSTQINALKATLDLYRTGGLVGAGIVAKEFGFRHTFQRTITNDDLNTTLTFNAQFQNNNAPAVGYGFKLLNKKQFITDNGDWCFDPSTNRLYVKSATSPAGTDIRICTRDYGVVFSDGAPSMHLDNIEIENQYLGGVFSISNDNLVIENCAIHDIIVHGIDLRGNSVGVNVSNNTINNINNNAINIGGIQGGEIGYNTIYDIGVQSGISIPYYVDWFRSVGCGVHMRWDILAARSVACNLTVHHNNIQNVGYIGIALSGVNNTLEYNYIDGFCTKWNDGGGIYSINRPYGASPATEDCTIRKNLIKNGIGNLEGVAAESSLHAEGIYLDNASTRILVDDNDVTKTSDYGIYVNFDTSYNYITNNRVSKCATGQIIFKEDQDFNYGPTNPSWSITFPYTIGNVCTGNTMVAGSNTQVCLEARSYDSDVNYNPFSGGGSCNNNIYVNPYRTTVNRHYGTTGVLYTLAGWVTKLGGDAGSSELRDFMLYDATTVDTDILHTFNNTASSVNDTPVDNYMGVSKNTITTQSIPAYSGVINLARLRAEDTFTGASGAITSHSPEIGGAYTLPVGTVTIDGSGILVASVAGDIYQTLTDRNVTVVAVGRVASTSAISVLLRYTDVNNYVQAQLSFSGTTVTANLINRVSGVNTTVATASVGTRVLNTFYSLRTKIINNRCIVSMDDTQFIDYTDASNANIGLKTAVNHGIKIPTAVSYDKLTIVKGF